MAQDETTKIPTLVFGDEETVEPVPAAAPAGTEPAAEPVPAAAPTVTDTAPAVTETVEEAAPAVTEPVPAAPAAAEPVADAAPTTAEKAEAVAQAADQAVKAAQEAIDAAQSVAQNAAPATAAALQAAMASAPAAQSLDMVKAQAAAEEAAAKGIEAFGSAAMLTPEEQAAVDRLADKIDIHNTEAVLGYGVGAQKHMSEFADKALENVRTKDLGEVGDMITDLVTELKGFDVDEKEKGLFAFFKKAENKAEALKTKYDKAEVNVAKIVQALEGHQVTLLKDIATMDQMYEQNLAYFKELTMYIAAGKKALAEVRSGELAEAISKAERTGLAEDAQAAKDLEALCDRFEKKIHDLELTRMIALQTAPQIRLVQDSDTMMVEKIQSTIVNTIPLWKNQMVIALGVEHSTEAAKAQREVVNVTNELLKKNAEKLKMATVETAKASERGIIDIETLKQTNETLISTLDEVMQIQSDGRAARLAAEQEMQRMEAELKNKLIQMSR